MANRKSSDRASKIASKYLRAEDDALDRIDPAELYRDLRTLAASVLAQDEVKGDAKATAKD